MNLDERLILQRIQWIAFPLEKSPRLPHVVVIIAANGFDFLVTCDEYCIDADVGDIITSIEFSTELNFQRHAIRTCLIATDRGSIQCTGIDLRYKLVESFTHQAALRARFENKRCCMYRRAYVQFS